MTHGKQTDEHHKSHKKMTTSCKRLWRCGAGKKDATTEDERAKEHNTLKESKHAHEDDANEQISESQNGR